MTVGRGDPRYADLRIKGVNARFTADPERFHLVGSTEQVVGLVRDAVRAGKRITVRGGGHSCENLVGDGAQVIIDLSEFHDISFARRRNALSSRPRAGPAPCSHPARRTPTCGGRTGAGGGNFGVVTRYWLRDPNARSTDPTRLLPRPPGVMLGSLMLWGWGEVDQAAFVRILRNYGAFFERHSTPGDRFASLFSALLAPRKIAGAEPGGFLISAELDGTLPDADALLTEFQSAITDGVPAPFVLPPERTPWLTNALRSGTNGESGRYKQKSAYLRRRFTDEQAEITYRHVTQTPAPAGAQEAPMLWLLSYGGAVNAVRPDATAMPQRDSILKAIFLAQWVEQGGDGIRRAREYYRDMYASTGGVPVPDDANDGCYINYPDIDTADPAWNTSGVPWHTLYFKDNYPRLQQIKARWDPRNVFHHALSIRPPR